MKKTTSIILGMMFIGALVFTGCKKNYTCECTYNGTTTSYEYTKVSKKDAKASCEAANIGGYSCSLK